MWRKSKRTFYIQQLISDNCAIFAICTCTLLAGYLRLCTHACTHTHTHMHNMCNTFCFSTATMVMQMCLKVTLYVHSLSCRVHNTWWLTKVSFRQVSLFLLTFLAPTALSHSKLKKQLSLHHSTRYRYSCSCPHHEGIWENRALALLTLTLASERGEGSASHPNHSTPQKGPPCTHWMEGSIGSTTSLMCSKSKISCPCQQFLNFSAHSLATVGDYVIPPPAGLLFLTYLCGD
jgi:hypothetical protein